MSNWTEMGEEVQGKLKSCGQGAKVYPLAKIIKPEVIELGDYSRFCDFTFIYGGKGIKIGRYVGIGLSVSLAGESWW